MGRDTFSVVAHFGVLYHGEDKERVENDNDVKMNQSL